MLWTFYTTYDSDCEIPYKAALHLYNLWDFSSGVSKQLTKANREKSVFLFSFIFVKGESEGKVSLCWLWRHKGGGLGEYIAALILNLTKRWRQMINFKSWPLYSRGKSPSTRWMGGLVAFELSLILSMR